MSRGDEIQTDRGCFQDNLSKGHKRITYACEKKKTRLISQLKYHSCWYNLPSAALALASNSLLSASISYLILKKMD